MKRYAIAGAGVRGLCFARGILEKHSDTAELVGLYDTNMARMGGFCNLLNTEVPCFLSFEELVKRKEPDTLIITTPDNTHADIIEQAFAYGLDAIVEKPMATTTEDVERILYAEKKYGKKIRVTFNYRFATYPQRIKEVLNEHDIGTIKNISLEWFLDKVHGAEYFRRWHASISKSGGLLVHKSTHHFDLVNWLLEDYPVAVSALGSLSYFGKNGVFRGENCRACIHKNECEQVQSFGEKDTELLTALYFDAENEDNYIRDNCVFREDIDIYDTMNVILKYKNGAQMSYALTAYAPWEGFRLTMTGTDGRIETQELHGGIMMNSQEEKSFIKVIHGTTRENISVEDIEIDVDKRDHGGGDDRLYQHMFKDNVPDPLKQNAGSFDGAKSCLIGICANQSILEERTVAIPDMYDSPEICFAEDFLEKEEKQLEMVEF